MSLPCQSTLPAVGLCTPATMLNKVVLPDPFGPMMPTILSSSIETSTPANAITPPNSLRSPVISSAGIGLGLFLPPQFRQQPSVHVEKAGTDATREQKDDEQQANPVGDSGIDRVQMHDFGQEAHDGCSNKRAVEQSGTTQHDHQRQVQTGKGTK